MATGTAISLLIPFKRRGDKLSSPAALSGFKFLILSAIVAVSMVMSVNLSALSSIKRESAAGISESFSLVNTHHIRLLV